MNPPARLFESPARFFELLTARGKRAQGERQARVREEETRYRALLRSMDQGFCIIELIYEGHGAPVDYRFVETNAAFETHSGLKGVVGRTILDLVPGFEPQWFEVYGQVARTGQAQCFQGVFHSFAQFFDVYASRIGDPAGNRLALLFTNTTASQDADEELPQLAVAPAQAGARENEFLAVLAHELRSPLAPLRSGLQVLRLAQGQVAVPEKTLLMMERQLAQMVHLVDDLLDVARIGTGKIELRKRRLQLRELVDNAVEASAPSLEAGHHALAVDLPVLPVELDVDPVRFAQVLGNLLNNAAKYTPDGGPIALSATLEADEVVIRVTDTGVGIPEASLGRVFELFAQVDSHRGMAQGGLGIGLALVRQLVELHGGSVSAQSAGSGAGSTFVLRLPDGRARAEPPRPQPWRMGQAARSGGVAPPS